MTKSNFRKCIYGELLNNENNNIGMIYSGKIGCYVKNLQNYFDQE